MSEVSIALNRFGLGARPDEALPTDPRAWLTAQLARYQPRPAVLAGLAGTPVIAAEIMDYQEQRRAVRQERRAAGAQQPDAAMTAGSAMQPVQRPPRDPDQMAARRQLRRTHYEAAIDARMASALVTPAPFAERMVHFWANHFAVSADKIVVTPLVGAFEFEAIRPHVTGKFRDMLGAMARHPAMLLYLDQAQSVGPGSRFAQGAALRGNKRGLNENFARELMELHTLGVRTGYSQADVTELARGLTGWSVAGIGRRAGGQGDPGAFRFAPAVHEPGARSLLGQSYAEGGEAQGQAMLDALARHPATATHVATKLARHFAGDDPPPAMVTRIAAAFRSSDGDLPTVYRAIIASPEAWAAGTSKFRTPWEWAVAAMRATGQREVASGSAVGLLNQLGQPVWKPGQPIGYDDIAATWAGPDAVMRRVEAAERIAARAPETDARALAAKLYPAALSDATATAIARAESPGQGLALLLVAPETMRR
ncbi:DUF1800 domain-containing protein [Sphingomonas sp. SUN019]|uniref:DUF1800 domain-containing protein n=1 Tax=Sphingomonas sp. SUN019 TaxID=2937788 RepID=UPI0021641B7F|nr:DUF1800 domain-containing protein [Sphingomonas sp. SUN019]UVO51729.1 DUF1800 domain-containing protein [Sphingomonas sp. SUN019]